MEIRRISRVYSQKVGKLEFIDRKQDRTRFYRKKVGELEFTDRKQENQSLQIESGRTGVYKQKVGELEFTDRKYKITRFYRQQAGKENLQIESRRTIEFTNGRKQENQSLQRESGRTGVCKLIFIE